MELQCFFLKFYLGENYDLKIKNQEKLLTISYTQVFRVCFAVSYFNDWRQLVTKQTSVVRMGCNWGSRLCVVR